jgi:hypothetical protein
MYDLGLFPHLPARDVGLMSTIREIPASNLGEAPIDSRGEVVFNVNGTMVSAKVDEIQRWRSEWARLEAIEQAVARQQADDLAKSYTPPAVEPPPEPDLSGIHYCCSDTGGAGAGAGAGTGAGGDSGDSNSSGTASGLWGSIVSFFGGLFGFNPGGNK